MADHHSIAMAARAALMTLGRLGGNSADEHDSDLPTSVYRDVRASWEGLHAALNEPTEPKTTPDWKAIGLGREARVVDAGSEPLTGFLTLDAAHRICDEHGASLELVKAVSQAIRADAARSVPAADAPDEREALRQAQAAAVMPMIGPLLDAWEGVPNDDKVELPGVAKWMRAINRAMEDTAPAAAGAAPQAMPADVNDLLKAMSSLAAESRGKIGVPIKVPELVSVEGRKFMRGEPSLFDRIPLGDVQAATDLLEETSATQPAVKPPANWEGAEEWMPLAWELCADDNGEDACNELVWEGGLIPEPWGDRWLKYEDEAKRMIALVRKTIAATQPAGETQAADGPRDGWRHLLDCVIDIYLDEVNHAPEHRTYVEGSFSAIIEEARAALARPAAGAGEGLTLALLNEAQNVEPVEDEPGASGLRWALGRALSDALGSTSEDGFVQVDPHDSDNIDPLVDAVLAALAGRTAQGGQGLERAFDARLKAAKETQS